MLYVDTSVLVATLVKEIHTDRIQHWLAGQDPEELAISDWVVTEFSSALSIKLRTGQIDAQRRASALAAFARLSVNSLNLLAVTATQFRLAARFADQHQTGVRAGDALHLAIAAENGLTLCTLDAKLAQAGLSLGVKTRLL